MQIFLSAVVGILLNVFWHPDANIDHPFLTQAQKLWRKPQWGGVAELSANPINYKILTWRSAMSYDATWAILEAAKKTPNPTRQKIQQTLSDDNFSFNGATGQVKFQQGERIAHRPFLVKINHSDSSTKKITGKKKDKSKIFLTNIRLRQVFPLQ